MLVYKYRSNYLRDIDLLSKSIIFAPNRQNLNDPFEGLISPNLFHKFYLKSSIISEQEIILNIIINNIEITKNFGIYSLSETWANELLWANYTNSHKGFCIEYNLGDLVDIYTNYLFPGIIKVNYKKKFPLYSLKEIKDRDMIKTEKEKSIDQLKLFIGTKSLAWKYEKEIRIIFEYYGEQNIKRGAINSIIFGVRASETDICYTIKKLPKGTKYYKIILGDDYKFNKKEIYLTRKDKIVERTYLNFFVKDKIDTDILLYQKEGKIYEIAYFY